VLGSITSIIASLQVADALQILAAGGPSLPLRITTVDVWSGAMRRVTQPAQDPECPACVHKLFPYLEGRFRKPISLCGRNAVQIHERERPIDLVELHARLEPLGEVRSNGFALRFFLPPYEMTVFPDGRAIVKGTTDIGIARSFYARFLGA
jgi:adenylyltransferase/sulfurtransferase